jgi:UTP-glucose-1-phosphate uridylyltransferase
MRGNLGAILTGAEQFKDEELFPVVWADELFLTDNEKTRTRQLVEAFDRNNKLCIAIVKVKESDIPKCGMVRVGRRVRKNEAEINQLEEKPKQWEDKNCFASVGGYIITKVMLTLAKSVKVSPD